MGRRIPSTAISSSINPAFSVSLLAASVAVMIAIIGALCAAKSRKTASPPPGSQSSSTHKTREPSNREPESETATTITVQQPTTAVGSSSSSSSPEDSNSKALQEEQLPPTPRAKGSPSSMSSGRPKRRLSTSLSMKIPTGNALAKFKSRKEETEKQKKDKSLKVSKPEDSIWMKTIILGEKCRVPNEEDAIIYDQNGNRISSYPARTPRSLPVSRTHSFIDQDYTL